MLLKPLRTMCTLVIMLGVLQANQISKAAVPQLINAQGKLTNVQGVPLTDGNYTLTFTIYDAASGGNIKWTETNPEVTVTNGQFNALLGSIIPIYDSVFAGDERCLGIKVGSDPEMIPRSRLVSVGYAQRVSNIDGAKGGTISDGLRVLGNVITEGTAGIANFGMRSTNPIGHTYEWYLDSPIPGSLSLFDRTSSAHRMTITAGGDVGVGTDHPAYKFHVAESSNSRYIALFTNAGGSGPGVAIESGAPGDDCDLLWVGDYSGQRVTLYANGNGKVGIGTTTPSTDLEVVGTTTTNNIDVVNTTSTGVLVIRGGADLAEPFEFDEGDVIPEGSVVVIDPTSPGKLMLSDCAYDKRVAGIVSGAGGVKPGMTMQQDGVMDGGINVALTGRVYALATAENGSIEPGDLLTTSNLAGHLMKATDESRCHGTVVGKAMSRLEKGEGLVLVLVNLQ